MAEGGKNLVFSKMHGGWQMPTRRFLPKRGKSGRPTLNLRRRGVFTCTRKLEVSSLHLYTPPPVLNAWASAHEGGGWRRCPRGRRWRGGSSCSSGCSRTTARDLPKAHSPQKLRAGKGLRTTPCKPPPHWHIKINESTRLVQEETGGWGWVPTSPSRTREWGGHLGTPFPHQPRGVLGLGERLLN